MKRIITAVLIVTLLVGLVACSLSKEDATKLVIGKWKLPPKSLIDTSTSGWELLEDGTAVSFGMAKELTATYEVNPDSRQVILTVDNGESKVFSYEVKKDGSFVFTDVDTGKTLERTK